MEQPRNESVTRIVNGEQTLVYSGLTYGEALILVGRLRRIMIESREYERKLGMPDAEHYWYYRLGKPHK